MLSSKPTSMQNRKARFESSLLLLRELPAGADLPGGVAAGWRAEADVTLAPTD
jgi:hypothetical protein